MKKIISILVLLIIISCVEKGMEKPENLISKDKMVDLLFDMHIANKTRNIKNLEKEKNTNYYAIISEKHKIDSTRFKESHAYYMYYIAEYEAIYKKLEVRFDTVFKQQELIIKIADSIKKIKDQKRIDSLKLLKGKKKLLKK